VLDTDRIEGLITRLRYELKQIEKTIIALERIAAGVDHPSPLGWQSRPGAGPGVRSPKRSGSRKPLVN